MKEKLIIQHYFQTLFIQQSMMKMGDFNLNDSAPTSDHIKLNKAYYIV
jgi:hypothetical protein